jgi:hypothetical protein
MYQKKSGNPVAIHGRGFYRVLFVGAAVFSVALGSNHIARASPAPSVAEVLDLGPMLHMITIFGENLAVADALPFLLTYVQMLCTSCKLVLKKSVATQPWLWPHGFLFTEKLEIYMFDQIL